MLSKQNTVKNEFYIIYKFCGRICKNTFYETILRTPILYLHITPFRQMFYLDIFHECKHDGIPKCAWHVVTQMLI